jgi:hypothetical protein
MRDEFAEETKRLTAGRAGYCCSNPDCQAPTSGPQVNPAKSLNLGVAAHITGASARGPRFDAALQSDDRRGADNAIWLCQNCAKLVDNDPERFDVTKLRAWKHGAEARALESIGKTAAIQDSSEAARKVRVMSAWIGAMVTLAHMNSGKAAMLLGPVRGTSVVTLVDCNEHFATVKASDTSRSIPLNRLDVSFDHNSGRLELQERHT